MAASCFLQVYDDAHIDMRTSSTVKSIEQEVRREHEKHKLEATEAHNTFFLPFGGTPNTSSSQPSGADARATTTRAHRARSGVRSEAVGSIWSSAARPGNGSMPPKAREAAGHKPPISYHANKVDAPLQTLFRQALHEDDTRTKKELPQKSPPRPKSQRSHATTAQPHSAASRARIAERRISTARTAVPPNERDRHHKPRQPPRTPRTSVENRPHPSTYARTPAVASSKKEAIANKHNVATDHRKTKEEERKLKAHATPRRHRSTAASTDTAHASISLRGRSPSPIRRRAGSIRPKKASGSIPSRTKKASTAAPGHIMQQVPAAPTHTKHHDGPCVSASSRGCVHTNEGQGASRDHDVAQGGVHAMQGSAVSSSRTSYLPGSVQRRPSGTPGKPPIGNTPRKAGSSQSSGSARRQNGKSKSKGTRGSSSSRSGSTSSVNKGRKRSSRSKSSSTGGERDTSAYDSETGDDGQRRLLELFNALNEPVPDLKNQSSDAVFAPPKPATTTSTTLVATTSTYKSAIFGSQSSATKGLTCLDLPDELLLNILTFLPLTGKIACSMVCKQFHSVSCDSRLWKSIDLSSCQLNELMLTAIGERRPSEINLSRCQGVTGEGLQLLLTECGAGIAALHLLGCNKVDDTCLHPIAVLCPKLTTLDLSWSKISDRGVFTLASGAITNLHSLSLQGCQRLTDLSVEVVASRFGGILRRLDLFGCFGLTPNAVQSIGKYVSQLRVLSLAQCPKIDDGAIIALAPKVVQLEELDMRGCKLITDASIRCLAAHCTCLEKLRLAKCSITSEALSVLANCRNLKFLDVMGCPFVTDTGVVPLLQRCTLLYCQQCPGILALPRSTGRHVRLQTNTTLP